MYEIRFTGAAEKYLKKIKEKGLKKAFQMALVEISHDPFIGKLKTGDLAGVYGFDVYYSRTNYELAYRIYETDGCQSEINGKLWPFELKFELQKVISFYLLCRIGLVCPSMKDKVNIMGNLDYTDSIEKLSDNEYSGLYSFY